MRTSGFYFFEQLPSTNEWALQQEREMPFFCITREQSLGRGRRDNQWHSHQGDLLLSYATEMLTIPNYLSVLFGMRLAEFFNPIGINIKVKWPNDLILFSADDKVINGSLGESKVGGILIETRAFENTIKVVFGIGLNLSPQHQKQAVISNTIISYQEVLLGVSQIVAELSKPELATLDLQQWQKYDCLFNQEIIFDVTQAFPNITPIINMTEDKKTAKTTYRYQMTAQGINEQGELVVYDAKSQYHTSLNNAFNIQSDLGSRRITI